MKNPTVKCVQPAEQGKKRTVKADEKQISRLTDKVIEQGYLSYNPGVYTA